MHKKSEDGIITERNKSLSFLLKSKPNEYMTPYQFIYKVVSLLLLNVLIMDIKGDAEYVFLGAPIWWQELSWVIEEFVSENDFTGKTIIPFGTSASSGFSLDNIEPLAEEANWMAPQRFRSSTSESEVINRIDGFNISFN